jgi:hypothetical protein
VAVSAPTPPDTSQAVDAAATQLGATNLDVSVRIDSPGDNGPATQTIAAQADAAQATAQAADTAQAASAQDGVAQAGTTQVAPANVAVSIRIASPGADGPVTQTSTANAAAQTVAPDTAPTAAGTAPAPSTPSTQPPAGQAATVAQPIPVATAGASVPSVWTWNWTWTCGDITDPGITQTIDTGIQGWIWTWNIDTMCAATPVAPTAATPISPPESDGLISPSPPPPVLPVPPELPQLPQVQEPQLPQVPDIVAPTLPAADAAAPLPATDEIAPAEAPAATPELAPFLDGSALPVPPQLELSPSRAKPAPALPWLAAEVSIPTESPETPPARKHAPPTRQPRASERAPLEVLAFPPLPTGGSAAGGTGGGGTAAVAALAVWMLLQLPGLAVLRLPPSRRSPRARVDDIRNRPG